MKIKDFLTEDESKYKGMMKWKCKNGHTKYTQPDEDFDICNICGTKKAKKIGIVK